MAEKTYWMRAVDGSKALMSGAGERDAWTVRGWTEADEPQPGEFVWLQHNQHGGRAKFPATVVEQWAAKGWHPSAPQEPVDLTKDPQLTDVPAEAVQPTEKTKPATRRSDEKE